MQFIKKSMLIGLILMSSTSLFALDHIIGLRFGGAVDRNVGAIQGIDEVYQYASVRGNFTMGLTYDFFPVALISISPEFHYHANRTANFSVEETSYKASWQELSVGGQLKLNLMGLFYWGIGGGAGFALTPKLDKNDYAVSSSVYPYFVMELGTHIPYIFLGALGKNDMTLGLHLALRGTSNIIIWKEQPEAGHFQNDFSVGLFVGVSLYIGDTLAGFGA